MFYGDDTDILEPQDAPPAAEKPPTKAIRKRSKPAAKAKAPTRRAKGTRKPIPLSKRAIRQTAFTRALVKKIAASGKPMLHLHKRIGVSYGALWMLSRGIGSPNARTAGKFAKFLGVSVEKLASMCA